MRRSTSRTVSRYSPTFARSAPPSLPCSRAMSSLTKSSRLALRRSAARRSAALPPSPNRRSKTSRGWASARQRGRRRRPRQIVLIDAGETVVALAHGLEQIHRHLERRKLRLLSDLLGRHLIDGDSEMVVGAFGPFGFRGAQECRVGGRVRARIGVLQLQVGENRYLILDRSSGLSVGDNSDRSLSLRGVHSAMFEPIGI